MKFKMPHGPNLETIAFEISKTDKKGCIVIWGKKAIPFHVSSEEEAIGIGMAMQWMAYNILGINNEP